MLLPYAYGAVCSPRTCGDARDRRSSRVEMGGRERRHAFLRFARARCDQDRAEQRAAPQHRTHAHIHSVTDDVIDAYIALKMQEVTKVRMSTHPLEFELYYSV